MIVVFDGFCNFCNGWTRFVSRHDRLHRFQFEAAQSDKGAELLQSLGLSTDRLETIILVDGQRSYQKSDAVVQILRHLGWLHLFAIALTLVPKRLRDAGYDAFARRRYKWFGKSGTCFLPNANSRVSFMQFPRVAARSTMRLSAEELARLEAMFASAQVRSDPAVASATDQLLDAMRRAAQEREATRRLHQQADKQAAVEAAPTHEPDDSSQTNRAAVYPQMTPLGEVNWNVPRSLDELILIRRALLRNEVPSLRAQACPSWD
ncbi:hypothetical protein LMG28727_06204 [Paraburkholderia kirstenboschensis]|uniref:thiol-disulfide oxidoreductase DCC family protein n=1 Tax=Paraburkholderia kirstenboschensis TaxID=1245436 RepID=UPI000ADF74EB|nr:thiol-disulfide oxidoreductase DCC family protein [Paraburkholderia kirstenboschensis]CAD6556822.1 hypothetical protein LMG28727_06204 [Paraburkholderia kirstenboschensis]